MPQVANQYEFVVDLSPAANPLELKALRPHLISLQLSQLVLVVLDVDLFSRAGGLGDEVGNV